MPGNIQGVVEVYDTIDKYSNTILLRLLYVQVLRIKTQMTVRKQELNLFQTQKKGREQRGEKHEVGLGK